jgi:methyl-branched lipid omega-hydroxylase
MTIKPEYKWTADEVDLSDLEFWTTPLEVREGAFEVLRKERPRPFFTEPDFGIDLIKPGPGYYALTRYQDIVDASRQPELFCSGRGATQIPDLPPEMLEFFGSMINMDDPRHKRLRDIVSKAFTVRQVRQIEEYIQTTADEIVDRVAPMGECDFVTDVAARLPLKVICDMMGVPESQYDLVFEKSNVILGAGDPEYVPSEEGQERYQAIMTAAVELNQLMAELAAEREKDPTDDLTSALINANVEGDKLSHSDLASFFILLVVAGNETTRNAISWGLWLLTQNPDQKELWQSDYDRYARGAVEEIVRWATPVIFMRRTVTRDGVKLGDQEFSEGDKMLLFYNSGNRDEDVFTDPYRFDITREPNNHIGFGGPGPHFCLGANLARQEIKVMFRELLTRVPDIRATGEPDRLRSNFINGIKHLPAAMSPAGA